MADEAQRGFAPAALRLTTLVGVGCALVVAGLLAYWPGLSNGFVNYDDRLYILGNSTVRLGLTGESVAWAFSTFYGANWFPMTWLSWMADVDLYGTDAAGFHLTSLLFHCTNSVLLFIAFARSTGRVASSAFVAAVFALHPLHVESVAWASARKDVLSATFWMLALIAYVEASRRLDAGDQRGKRFLRACVALCLVLGLMAKPILVVLPFALILMDAWPLRRLRIAGGTLRLAEAFREKLPLFAIAVAGVAMTIAAQSAGGAVQSLTDLGILGRLENAAVSYMAYLAHAIWPSGLAAYYPHPMNSLPAWKVGFALILGAAATWSVCRAWPHWPHLAMGWFWFGGTLIPVIGIVQVGQAAMADRYMYLPLIGLSIIVAFSADQLIQRRRAAGFAAIAVGAAVLIALSVATRNQVQLWKDSTTLFEHALAVTDRNHVAHINIGVALVNTRRFEEAEVHLRQAVEIAPGSAIGQGVLAEALRGRSKPARAMRHYRAALERDPDSSRWLDGLGGALLDLGRAREAVDIYRRALEIDPSARIHGNLGLALQTTGANREAIAHFDEALRLQPDIADVQGHLGIALMETQQTEDAIVHLERELARDPDLPLIQARLALALMQRDGPAAGLDAIAHAIALEPQNAQFHEIAARMARGANRTELAIIHYRTAIELGERSVGNLNDLAWLLATGNDAEGSDDLKMEAVVLANEAVQAHEPASAEVLDTLAVAHAAARQWPEAIEAATHALAVVESSGTRSEFAEEIRERILDYRTREANAATQ